MATAIIRPTTHLSQSYITYPTRCYDNDNSTKLTAKSSGYPRIVLGAFDMSAIPQSIVNGGKIKNISICIYGNKLTSNLQIRAVRDADNSGGYTDCGDDKLSVEHDFTVKEYSVDCPKATAYWNSNLSAFMAGGFQVRLYFIDDESSIYEVYAKVEYEGPAVAVTTSATPAEGGTVTGGGTYESGSTVTVTATPNEGYKFSHWLINGVNSGSSNPISGVLASDTTVTAVFEKTSVNNIYIGTAQPKEIYIGTQKVKGIYVGTKAIYET